MAFITYAKEDFLVKALNTVAKQKQGADTEVRFELSSKTRQSLADTKKSIIDFAKVEEMKGGKQILRVYLVKNFTQGGQLDIKPAMLKMGKQLRTQLSKLSVGTRYSWSKGKALDETELTANIDNKWGDVEGTTVVPPTALAAAFNTTKGSTRDISKLMALGDEGDKSVLTDNQMAGRFLQYMDTAPTLVLPRKVWRDLGFSASAIKQGIKVAAPESGSSLIGVWRADFEKVAATQGWTVTENSADAKEISPAVKPYQGHRQNAGRIYRDEVDGNKKAYESQVNGDAELAMAERMSDPVKYAEETARLQKMKDKYETVRNNDIMAVTDDMRNDASRLAGHLAITPEQHAETARLKRKLHIDAWKAADAKAKEKLDATPERALDLVMTDRQEKAQSSVAAISQKMIVIKKHPTSNYFIITMVSGQRIPTY